jgi:hypothetical protein
MTMVIVIAASTVDFRDINSLRLNALRSEYTIGAASLSQTANGSLRNVQSGQ